MLFTHHPLTFLGEKSQRLVRAAFISSLKAPLGVSQLAEARLARQSRGRGSRRLGVTMVRVWRGHHSGAMAAADVITVSQLTTGHNLDPGAVELSWQQRGDQ